MTSSKENRLALFKAYADQCVKGGFKMDEHLSVKISNIIELINNSQSVMLIGNPGGGKTFIMECIRRLIPPGDPRSFISKSAIQIVTEFNIDGHEALVKYKGKNLFIDDLGAELKGKHFGEIVDVMEILIQMRYDDFTASKTLTHFTSNYRPAQLYSRYGLRVESRLKGMSTVIIIGGDRFSEDFRPLKNFLGFAPFYHPTEKSALDLEWEEKYRENLTKIKEKTKADRESGENSLGSILKKHFGTDHLQKPNDEKEG